MYKTAGVHAVVFSHERRRKKLSQVVVVAAVSSSGVSGNCTAFNWQHTVMCYLYCTCLPHDCACC